MYSLCSFITPDLYFKGIGRRLVYVLLEMLAIVWLLALDLSLLNSSPFVYQFEVVCILRWRFNVCILRGRFHMEKSPVVAT